MNTEDYKHIMSWHDEDMLKQAVTKKLYNKVLANRVTAQELTNDPELKAKTVKQLKNFAESAKDERIRGLQPRYEMGSVFHPQKTSVPLVDFFEDELLRFPKGRNDDMIDSLASQLELAFPPKVKEERTTLSRAVYPA
jgi:phage terminase large subunit-like protein